MDTVAFRNSSFISSLAAASVQSTLCFSGDKGTMPVLRRPGEDAPWPSTEIERLLVLVFTKKVDRSIQEPNLFVS